MAVSRIVAKGMLRENTPLEDHRKSYGLWVKREDKACVYPGPAFSKARGVYAHLLKRPEELIGVLDTRHSQAGHAVARACQVLGKSCINYYPEFKHEPGHRPPQERAKSLGAKLYGLPAGRSAILFHQARKNVESKGGYMMPNALKLDESIEETAKECCNLGQLQLSIDYVLIPISSGTIAAGVIKGLGSNPTYLIHLGYTRSHDEVEYYIKQRSGVGAEIVLIDEGYQYKDIARAGETPPWPCNEYYDLKAFRWWVRNQARYPGNVLMWNIG